jgi:hypothetical protein
MNYATGASGRYVLISLHFIINPILLLAPLGILRPQAGKHPLIARHDDNHVLQ